MAGFMREGLWRADSARGKPIGRRQIDLAAVGRIKWRSAESNGGRTRPGGGRPDAAPIEARASSGRWLPGLRAAGRGG
jgi:hypothetical protein